MTIQHMFVKTIIFTSLMISLLGSACNNKPNDNPQQVVDEGDGCRDKHPTCERLAFQLSSVINDITTEIQLRSVAKTTGASDSEFRLWTNVGSFFEKLLVVRQSERKSSAAFYDVQRNGNSVTFEKKILSAPKAGWESFVSIVLDKHIEVPLKLRFDQPTNLTRDEGVILLEILDHGKYDFVYYGQHTSSEDGKNLLNFCEYLALEFAVDLDCLGSHTSP